MTDGSAPANGGDGARAPTGRPSHAADGVGVALFVAVGEVHHGVNPVTSPALYLDSLVPFAIGWFVVAAIATTAVSSRASWQKGVTGAVALWIPACLIGLGLRSTALFRGQTPLVFALVAVVGGAVFVAGARASVLVARRQMSL